MPTNINPNYVAGTEDSNQLYNTQIPTLSEDANIQEALRLYHYGVASGVPLTGTSIIPQSIAGHLKTIESKIVNLESKGPGSVYATSRPTSVDSGFLWVDASSSASIAENGRPIVSFFQANAPTSGATTGMIWIDSVTLSLYVYDGDSWELISSSGTGSAGYSETNMSGLGVDITGLDAATASGLGLSPIFGYIDGTTPIPLTASIVSTLNKNEVEFVFGLQSATSVAGDIEIARVINNNFAAPTTIGKVRFLGGAQAPQIKIVDLHSQVPGTIVSYVLINAGTSPITFDGNYIIQAIVREVS
jgi:hypothetical protein